MSPERLSGPRKDSLEDMLVNHIHGDDEVAYVGTITGGQRVTFAGRSQRVPTAEIICGLKSPNLESLNSIIAILFRNLQEIDISSTPSSREIDVIEPTKNRRNFKLLLLDREIDKEKIKRIIRVSVYYDEEIARSVFEKRGIARKRRKRRKKN